MELREFRLQVSDQRRTVRHFLFLGWPDHDAPEDPQPFLSFIDHLRTSGAGSAAAASPLLVHCSAGVGRSGTFVSSKQGSRGTGSVEIDVLIVSPCLLYLFFLFFLHRYIAIDRLLSELDDPTNATYSCNILSVVQNLRLARNLMVCKARKKREKEMEECCLFFEPRFLTSSSSSFFLFFFFFFFFLVGRCNNRSRRQSNTSLSFARCWWPCSSV